MHVHRVSNAQCGRVDPPGSPGIPDCCTLLPHPPPLMEPPNGGVMGSALQVCGGAKLSQRPTPIQLPMSTPLRRGYGGDGGDEIEMR